jgi:hypothetical protein
MSVLAEVYAGYERRDRRLDLFAAAALTGLLARADLDPFDAGDRELILMAVQNIARQIVGDVE